MRKLIILIYILNSLKNVFVSFSLLLCNFLDIRNASLATKDTLVCMYLHCVRIEVTPKFKYTYIERNSTELYIILT